MGACQFSNLMIVKGDANTAYQEACEEMNDYNGHQDGYSGDIQTTMGFGMAKDAPRYGTKAFDKWENKMYDKLDKRDCLCVEITGAPFNRIKQRRGLKGKKGYRAFYFFGWAAE